MSSLISFWPESTLELNQDRGLHYGDGLFETVLYEEGALQFWDRHLKRLTSGCHRLGLEMPEVDDMLHHLSGILPAVDSAVVKLVVTAGVTGRGYARDDSVGVMYCYVYSAPAFPQGTLLKLQTSPVRLANQPLLAGLKHLNRLEQVLAKRALDSEYFEGLMLDQDGHVIEGIMSNVFALTGSTLITPKLSVCGVAGIMRSVVMDVASIIGLTVTESVISPEQLLESDMIFVCNSVIGLRIIDQWEHWRTTSNANFDTLHQAVLKKQQQEQFKL